MDYKQEDTHHEHASNASQGGDKASFDSPTIPSGAVHVSEEDVSTLTLLRCIRADFKILHSPSESVGRRTFTF